MNALLSSPQIMGLVNLIIACFLGGIIGFEREMSHKPAGLRTHAFVAAAAALFVFLSFSMIEQYSHVVGSDILKADPIRVFQSIILGFSFIGAGTIIKDQEGQIHGLTTATSLLLAVTIGIAVALQQYILAVGITFIVVVFLRLFHLISKAVK